MTRPRRPRSILHTRSLARACSPLLGVTLTLGISAALAARLTGSPVPVQDGEAARRSQVFFDSFDPATGRLTGGVVDLDLPADLDQLPTLPSDAATLFTGGDGLPSADPASGTRSIATGAADNRVDLVFVGDGYTAADMPTYVSHVDSAVAGMFDVEPLTSYIEAFAVHRVDVVSNESGVDNDPVDGIDRDTAMNMRYFCNGTERLLCVSVSLANQFAQNAPGVDQIVALANSTKYGGAGYLSADLATSSGGNGAAIEIIKHELGHSMGDLADEYTYGGPSDYQGSEPNRVNASLLDSVAMAQSGQKWAGWLGSSVGGFDGTIGTYEGAVYSQTGVYRPSPNSLMRNLGRTFNLVGAEAMIKAIYDEVSPVDDCSDPGALYGSTETLFVDALIVDGAPLPVTWTLGGAVVGSGPTFDLSSIGAQICGGAVLTATVRDGTPWVRDEAFRDAHMTASVDFQVGQTWRVPTCAPTPHSQSAVGSTLQVFGSPSLSDQNLTLYAGDGRPGAPILFFYGSEPILVPYGQGTICVGGSLQRLAIAFYDQLGGALHDIDFQADPVALPGTALLPGTSWIFQGWFRDLDPMGMQSFDFTSAVQVTFCP